MIRIYGSPQSSAGRCYWALEEAEVPYEQVAVSFADKEHKSAEYLALNPNGKVPVFVDGDLVLWESIAINRYIAAAYRPGLLGEGVADQARVEQWSVWSQVDYQPPMIALFIQLVFVPEERRDQAKMDAAREKLAPLNRILDAHLAENGQMVGSEFTLGDLNVASVALLNSRVGVDLSGLPNLQRWLEKTLARPARLRVEALG